MGTYYEHVKGTVDFYPPHSSLLQHIASQARDILCRYGYQEIMLPILEPKDVFARGVGQTSDIVERQMFQIKDKDVVLRPEGTAQVVRSYIENSLYKQSGFHKFFYIGPMFRGERPQKGRLRQFHHIGAEVFGIEAPSIDAEIITLGYAILRQCGIKNITLKLNSLGCSSDKEKFTEYLKKQLESKSGDLCPLCQKRVNKNPLRVLDCKERSCRKIVTSLAVNDEHLCKACRHHFSRVKDILGIFEVPFTQDPYLVRGLDYYTNTVFEFVSSDLGAQDACGAGGRYNNLVQTLGGPAVPAIGFALGVERMMLICPVPEGTRVIRVFVAFTANEFADEALRIVNDLRRQQIASDLTHKPKSLKSQLRVAERLGAEFVVILGEAERKEGCLSLRNMRESTQQKIPVDNLIAILKDQIQ